MNIQKREKFYYIKSRLLPVWGSYMLFTGIFMLVADLIRGLTQPFSFYFSAIIIGGFFMALLEMFFFRKVIKVDASDRIDIENRIEVLLYQKSDRDQDGREFFIMSGRTYFLRSADIMLSEVEEVIYLNINIFHLRYFKKYQL